MTCKLCASDFSGDPRQRYCSDECRKEAARQRASAWYAERKGDPDLKARVAAASRRSYARICGDLDLLAATRAATHEWRARNADRMAEQYRAWRLSNPDAVRAKVQRRRARLIDAFVEDVYPAVVWARDGGECGICQTLIDPALLWPDRMSMTLDHIIPLARGGNSRVRERPTRARCLQLTEERPPTG